ncbi:heme exporter protein CcmA [Legionella geestiana]|uniref:Heme exporter protein CcmA n=1 Tax=Legionella geestiana TaxID=45065 RepID=A0A0W0UB81_9GAMM|nr:cytochrome c biogenesis heme-transporting ATPase CcmA [Legionella geestiana]KTD04855.1 heme exporter protein CcmA [Legionella geestiana]QBS11318.1 cytochrome c biogenesis heme-transporting ATPase CcmA [Legionella geestiana]STX54043.1 heme exporter protein CcmA [Legionella geestiana]
MLEAGPLSFGYAHTPLLRGVSLALKPGDILHLRAGNGRGKTTLLRILAGLLAPDSGSVRFDGRDIQKNLAAHFARLCFIGHRNAVHPALTPREHCRFLLRQSFSGCSIETALTETGLMNVADMPAGLLSEGQQRRLALTALLLSNATLWLLDEPLNALDAEGIEHFAEHLKVHQERGGMVVLTSHQPLPLVPFREYLL